MQTYKYLLGDGACPSADDFEFFINEKMAIFLPRSAIDLPRGTHIHSSYEFSFCSSGLDYALLERKGIGLEQGGVYPFNPEQAHGMSREVSGITMMGLHINKDFINEVSRQIYGKENVCFKNENCTVSRELRSLIQMLINEYRARENGYRLAVDCMCTQTVVNLFRTVKSNMPVILQERNYNERDNINKVVNYLKENYNGEISLEQLSSMSNLSLYHFIRVFKSHTGKTPYQYLLDIKIEKAAELLKSKKYRMTVSDVAYSCGFNNLSHFITVFKRKKGISPLKYVKQVCEP
jgi:AraC-type DNA-binding domain-containing proteins